VTDNYRIEWKKPNVEGLIDFICKERDFSETRVMNALQKMQKGTDELKAKTTLEKWFG